MRIHGFRYQLIGDMVAALPLLNYYEKKFPNSFKSWGIAKKVSQVAPCFLNHKLINQIFIFDGQEGPESERDFEFIKSHDLIIEGNPKHKDHFYPNQFNIYSEAWRMIELPIEEWNKLSFEEQCPRLDKWWNDEIKVPSKTIAYFPCAGYGREHRRNASSKWCDNFIKRLVSEGYNVWQFGHPNDYTFDIPKSENFRSFKNLSFFEQIKLALSTDLIIGTDSGSALVIGAYQVPQISLLTDHGGHANNPMALSTNNPNNHSFFAEGSADNIIVDDVIEKIKEKIK